MPDFPGSQMPKTLSAAEKIRYKRSIATMVIFWIINTRHTWRERLLAFNPAAENQSAAFTKWETDIPALSDAFRLDDQLDRAAWNGVFQHVYSIIKVQSVQDSLYLINTFADVFWVHNIDIFCPSDEAINVMLEGVFQRIDALPE